MSRGNIAWSKGKYPKSQPNTTNFYNLEFYKKRSMTPGWVKQAQERIQDRIHVATLPVDAHMESQLEYQHITIRTHATFNRVSTRQGGHQSYHAVVCLVL